MFKKSQIRFFCTIMGLFFVVFIAILGVSVYINVVSRNVSIDDRLKRLENNYNVINSHEGLVATISPNAKSIIELNAIIFDTQTNFTEETIFDILLKASSYTDKNATEDSIGKIYFRTKLLSDNRLLVVAADMSEVFFESKANVVRVAFALSIIYTILVIIVWTISYKIMQPIEETFYRQQKFISDASHELKTPIAVISANADVLKVEGTNKYLDSIKSQTTRMTTLVEDMLMLARMDEANQPIHKEEFNLSDVINETILPFDAVAFENNKILLSEIEENVMYNGDKDAIKEIVNILMDNAIKYSSDGGTIKVTLIKNTLTVSNSGSNIKDEDSNKIFERFYRGEVSRSRETGGSGLGLSIAKGLATKNKWSISAKSKYGESMTITVSM